MSSFKDRYIAAVAIATTAHYGTYRAGNDKGPKVPYITHPIEVAAIAEHYGLSEDQILALVVHDVLEDGGDRKRYSAKIKLQLGDNVLRIVEGLSDPEFPEGMTRKEKKKAINERLSGLDDDVQEAKLCDITHNIRDIISAKPSFAKKYLAEKKDQIDSMSARVKQTPLYRDVSEQMENLTAQVTQHPSGYSYQ